MHDQNNPNNALGIEHQELQDTIIHSPDGRETRLRRTTEAAVVDCNGTKTFQGIQHALRTIDGKNLTDPVLALQCSRCKRQPLSQTAVVTCTRCQQTVCIARCQRQWQAAIVCPRCWWRSLGRYLCSIK